MSERGAEGILRKRAEDRAAAEASKPAPTSEPAEQPAKPVKESRVKNAAKGAAGGAGAGPEGALGGAALGFLAGKKKKTGGGKKALVAEFGICMVILALTPLSKNGATMPPSAWMKKASAIAGVFIVLGFVSSGGPTARRAANGLGALIALGTLLSESSIFTEIVSATTGTGTPVSTSAPVTTQSALGASDPQSYVNRIFTGDPSIQPAGSDFTSILGTFPGVVGTPANANVGIPGLPPGIGGN